MEYLDYFGDHFTKMPQCTWEKIAEVKHALSQERTILCGAIIRLKNLDIDNTIKKFETADKRLKKLEEELVELIEEANNGL